MARRKRSKNKPKTNKENYNLQTSCVFQERESSWYYNDYEVIAVPQAWTARSNDEKCVLASTDMSTCCMLLIRNGKRRSLSHVHQHSLCIDNYLEQLINSELKWTYNDNSQGNKTIRIYYNNSKWEDVCNKIEQKYQIVKKKKDLHKEWLISLPNNTCEFVKDDVIPWSPRYKIVPYFPLACLYDVCSMYHKHCFELKMSSACKDQDPSWCLYNDGWKVDTIKQAVKLISGSGGNENGNVPISFCEFLRNIEMSEEQISDPNDNTNTRTLKERFEANFSTVNISAAMHIVCWFGNVEVISNRTTSNFWKTYDCIITMPDQKTQIYNNNKGKISLENFVRGFTESQEI